MSKKVLIIIAQQGYQDQELEGTRKGLTAAGFEVVLASTVAGKCRGKFGGTETASIAMHDVHAKDYDRVAFIGGPGAAALKDDPDAPRIARDAVGARKPLGAICIAPTILATAGVLKGKRATVWDDPSTDSGQALGEQARFIESHGASFTGELVTIDGLIVTGNGPGAAEEFGKKLACLTIKN